MNNTTNGETGRTKGAGLRLPQQLRARAIHRPRRESIPEHREHSRRLAGRRRDGRSAIHAEVHSSVHELETLYGGTESPQDRRSLPVPFRSRRKAERFFETFPQNHLNFLHPVRVSAAIAKQN